MDRDRLRTFAEALADDARALALPAFAAGAAARLKPDRSPVTDTDEAIERHLRARITAEFPTHGVLGEEEAAVRADAEWLWVLDPIDGTKAFATGSPLFGTLIGVLHRGEPVLGVLEAPALGRRWVGDGGQSTCDGQPVRTRDAATLGDAVLYCTALEPMLDGAGAAFTALRRAARWTCFGADCVAYGLLASGTCDLVVDRGLRTHDWAALAPIVTGAGGTMTDWSGRPLRLGAEGDVVAAATAELARAARALVAG